MTNLLAQLILDVTLNATQHEGLEDHMQTSQLMLVQLATFVLCSVLNIFGEPFVELVMRIEQTGHNEMQKSPQL